MANIYRNIIGDLFFVRSPKARWQAQALPAILTTNALPDDRTSFVTAVIVPSKTSHATDI
jgi:hypothetical protein